MEIMAPPGMEDLTSQIQGMFQQMSGTRRSVKKMKVADALKVLIDEEAAKLINDDVYVRDPSLGNVRYLSAQPMASVELHFKEGKWLRNIPNDVTVLVDAKYQMTFLDYAQVWPDQKSTFLYVTVSDFEALMPVTPERRNASGEVELDLHQPKTAIDYILAQLQESVPFHVHDLDLRLTRMDTNSGEELFANNANMSQAIRWMFKPSPRISLHSTSNDTGVPASSVFVPLTIDS